MFGYQNKDKFLVLAILLLFWAAIQLLNYQNFESKKTLYLEKELSSQSVGWKSVQSIHESGVDAYFNSMVMNDEVLDLLKQIQDPAKERLARLKLFRKVEPMYRLLRDDGIYIFHFHTRDIKSLLRMHMVHKFGDDITAQRPSVVQVNETLKPIHGFEVGKVYSGFRHIYPVEHDNTHLGSVEFSQTFEAMRKKMTYLDDQYEYLMIHRKDLLASKVSVNFDNRFGNSIFSDNWLEEDPLRQLPGSPPVNSTEIQNVANKLKTNPEFQQKLSSGKDFAFLAKLNGADYVLTFIGLNNITNQSAGYLISFQRDHVIATIRSDAIIVSVASTFLLGILLFFVWGWLGSKKKQEQSLNFLENINQTMSEGLCVINADGQITEVNEACLHFLAQERSNVLKTPLNKWFKLNQPDTNVRYCLFDYITDQIEFTDEFNLSNQHQEVWLQLSCRPLLENDQVVAYVIVFRDITSQKQDEINLRIAAAAFETQEGILITDCNGMVLRVNQAFTTLTGYDASEIVGKTPALLNSGRQSPEFYQQMWSQLKQDNAWQGEIWNRRKDGTLYLEWLTISAVTDASGEVTRYVANFSDITEQKKTQEEIVELAFYDPLTKLPNRRLLFERLEQAVVTSERYKEYGAIIFIDLDNFKTLNDSKGHSIGDELLFEVAKILTDSVRKSDTVARLGGDEFVILLERIGTEKSEVVLSVEQIAFNIIDRFSQPFVLTGGIEHHSTPSIGIEVFCDQHDSVDEILKHADLAMYQSKKQGRNTVRFFNPLMQEEIERAHGYEEDLRKVINEDFAGLNLYYQSQVNEDGNVMGVEALIRWHHAEKGMISPADFIPIIEKNGMIVTIGHWVLEEAIRQLISWQHSPALKHLTLAVNISAKQLLHPNFISDLNHLIQQHSFDVTKLKIELTESSVVNDIDQAIRVMQEIRKLGIELSMDDFGTGYSSLSYLNRLPLNQLKIDQSFVRNLGSSDDSNSIVKTIIAMAHNMKLSVVAEGVETEFHYDFLKQQQCDFYQGYLFNRPLPAAEFEQFVLSRT